MKDYMAPMEGVTNFVYRRTYHRFYHPMDKYFTPFISAKPKKNLSFQEICEVSPELELTTRKTGSICWPFMKNIPFMN